MHILDSLPVAFNAPLCLPCSRSRSVTRRHDCLAHNKLRKARALDRFGGVDLGLDRDDTDLMLLCSARPILNGWTPADSVIASRPSSL